MKNLDIQYYCPTLVIAPFRVNEAWENIAQELFIIFD